MVVVALAGLVGLNVMSNQMRPKSDHEEEAEAKSATTASASPAAVSTSPVGVPGETPLSDPNSLVLVGEGNATGLPTAKQEVTVGFSWTPEVQSDPSKVSKAVDTLQKALGSEARIKVINVDEKPEVPGGISIGGKVIVPAQASGVIDPQSIEVVRRALTPSTPVP